MELSVIFVVYMYKFVKKEVVNGVIIIELDKYGIYILCIDFIFIK